MSIIKTRKTTDHFEKAMLHDVNGVYFIGGCRVRDIYSEKYGTVEGISKQHVSPHLSVLFDKHSKPVVVRPIMLEIVGGGLNVEELDSVS